MLLYIRFYIQNIYWLRKNKIKIKTNFIIYIDIYKIIKFIANNWYNAIVNIINNSNNKNNNNYITINLAEFEIYTKIL